jgi:hypothetical protein
MESMCGMEKNGGRDCEEIECGCKRGMTKRQSK